MKIFVDSDVIISSLLSEHGASRAVLRQKEICAIISNYSIAEIRIVIDRLGIRRESFEELLEQTLSTVTLEDSLEEIRRSKNDCVYDIHDAHIVAGAVYSEADFIATYNRKDYNHGRIKDDFGILICTPGQLLQFLRTKRHIS